MDPKTIQKFTKLGWFDFSGKSLTWQHWQQIGQAERIHAAKDRDRDWRWNWKLRFHPEVE